ncbi:MAG: hypothetical protein RSF73_04960 [Ruthenibacterium sp.]
MHIRVSRTTGEITVLEPLQTADVEAFQLALEQQVRKEITILFQRLQPENFASLTLNTETAALEVLKT